MPPVLGRIEGASGDVGLEAMLIEIDELLAVWVIGLPLAPWDRVLSGRSWTVEGCRP
ncbi:hypothetical protein ACFVZH_33665 [Streptomyces sp. NPDC059534]|uniref:hypothetical protein n=1 Tax=Streptomyces sp. NPDC059534 TaxID=3346859 RepID=UPI0036B5F8EA